jgi:hypothetical protein
LLMSEVSGICWESTVCSGVLLILLSFIIIFVFTIFGGGRFGWDDGTCNLYNTFIGMS